MAHEFKPGDLAIVILSRTGLNLGKCVTIERAVVVGETVQLSPRVAIEGTAKSGWLVSGDIEDIINGTLYTLPRHVFEGRGLMPLKGDEQPAQVRQAERVQ